MFRIGLSSCGFEFTDENFKSLRESGISAIEVSMKTEKYAQLDHRSLAELANRHGVEIWSYHLPFAPFDHIDVSSLNKELRENAVNMYTELIGRAADVGINKFIVHPSGEPIGNGEREERIGYSMQTLDRLAEIAHKNGAVIAVEDLPRTCLGNCADELLRILGANDKLRVCFDTNHLLTDSSTDFIRKLAHRIITLHVSDYDRLDEKHWLPGEGVNDWQAIYSTLNEVGYKGVWLYELSLRIPKTLSRPRELTFADFVQNARAIFDGRVPEKIS